MMWERDLGVEHVRSADYSIIAIVIFTLIGTMSQNPIAFIAVGIFVSYYIITKIYDNEAIKKLTLKNERRTIRLFPGEEEKLTMTFGNGSAFPLINGEIQFQTDPSVRAASYAVNERRYWDLVKVPLSVVAKRKTVIDLPFIAEQRGTSRINHIQYIFPHLLNFATITLKYKPIYETEFIVYPEIKPIQGVEEAFQMVPGEQRANFSPFEDLQTPLGTRDYSYSDPFHRVNWKASAKTQQLQTNVFENVVDMSYVFIVNLELDKEANMAQFTNNMEKLLSYTAFLCEYATKNNFPYELFINTRRPGPIPYIHMSEDVGESHFLHSLEMLARIPRQSMTVPFNEMLYRIGQQFYKPQTIIILGDIPTDASIIIDRWTHQQQYLYEVISYDEGAVVTPLNRGGGQIAK